MPRITVLQSTPTDRIAGLGITAAYPTWKLVNFTVEVWDKDPKRCERVGAAIEDAIGANRNYSPATVTLNAQSGVSESVSANGYFFILRISGGTGTMLVKPTQLYRRVLIVTGRWMQTA
jgi:hypothetical protein